MGRAAAATQRSANDSADLDEADPGAVAGYADGQSACQDPCAPGKIAADALFYVRLTSDNMSELADHNAHPRPLTKDRGTP